MRTWSKESQKKIIHPKQLEDWQQRIKAQKKTIATLNGAFDILHTGHLHILFEASQMADTLIVALNSDMSIKKNKGDARPINTLEKRLEMLSSISFVSFVTWFEETTPISILRLIKPNVHVNGEEYKENCIEEDIVHEMGGKVHFVKRLPKLSTTGTIQKLCD